MREHPNMLSVLGLFNEVGECKYVKNFPMILFLKLAYKKIFNICCQELISQ